MDFSIDDLAALARIELGDSEKKKLAGDLANILKYVEQINELDLEDVEPTSHVLDIENVFREDKVVEQPEVAKDVIKALPEDAKEGPFFKVPKVIEGIE